MNVSSSSSIFFRSLSLATAKSGLNRRLSLLPKGKRLFKNVFVCAFFFLSFFSIPTCTLHCSWMRMSITYSGWMRAHGFSHTFVLFFRNKVAARTGNRSNNTYFFFSLSILSLFISIHFTLVFVAFHCRPKLLFDYVFCWNATKFPDTISFSSFFMLFLFFI